MKNNKPAEAYAGRAREAIPELNAKQNMSKLDTLDVSVAGMSKSAGDEAIKTDGIEMRGFGAATKGKMSRGPMA